MIAVLLAPPRIAPGGLDMAIVMGADPHLFPGRWNGQRLQTRQHFGIAYQLALRIVIGKALAMAAAADARHLVVDVAQLVGTGDIGGLVIVTGIGGGSSIAVHDGLLGRCAGRSGNGPWRPLLSKPPRPTVSHWPGMMWDFSRTSS